MVLQYIPVTSCNSSLLDCSQVSVNGGRTWYVANGRESWEYVHRFTAPPASLADTSDCHEFRSDGESEGMKSFVS